MTDDTPDTPGVPTMQQALTDALRAQPDDDVLASFTAALKTVQEAHEPGLAACVEMTDLSIAYKPVCPRAGSATVVADVKRLRGGGYLIVENGIAGSPQKWLPTRVTAEQLRVMRARYLYRHGIYYELLARELLMRDERDWVIAHYFEGAVMILPIVRERYKARPMSAETEQAWKLLPTIKPNGAWWQS